MLTNAEPDLLVDTSIAVAFSVADHSHHDVVFGALSDRKLGLAGHAAFETFSVLTRLPPPARLTPAAAIRVLSVNFRHSRFLDARLASELLSSFPSLGVAGGSVYDALVAAVAREHRLTLGTRDRRAIPIYRAFDIHYQLIGANAH